MKKKISILGSGYVGAISGIGLANLGHQVEIVDVDEKKIKKWNDSDFPIYEQGLSEYYKAAINQGNLSFSTNLSSDSDFYFVAVGTPKKDNLDNAELKFVESAVSNIANIAKNNSTIVMKSTVPVGTNSNLQKYLVKKNNEISLVSNPEFLREGSAFSDFFNPDRIILGGIDDSAINDVESLYSGLENRNNFRIKTNILKTNFESAELIKHSSNGFLATKLSYINEIAQLSQECGANIQDVISGMGYDPRIGAVFLQSGPGWGGSCFPKDSKELYATARDFNVDLKVLSAAISSNTSRKMWCASKAIEVLKNYEAKKVGIFGVAFKAFTDDVRESSAFDIVKSIESEGFSIVATDEEGLKNFKKEYGSSLNTSDLKDIISHIDSAVIITEWPIYTSINWSELISNKKIKCVVDFRNITNNHENERIFKF